MNDFKTDYARHKKLRAKANKTNKAVLFDALASTTITKQPDILVYPPDDARDGCLARAGIAREDQVMRQVEMGQTGLFPRLAERNQVDGLAHLRLDLVQPDQRVQFRECLGDRFCNHRRRR